MSAMSYKEYICFFYDFRASGKRESKISIAKDYYMFKKRENINYFINYFMTLVYVLMDLTYPKK